MCFLPLGPRQANDFVLLSCPQSLSDSSNPSWINDTQAVTLVMQVKVQHWSAPNDWPAVYPNLQVSVLCHMIWMIGKQRLY